MARPYQHGNTSVFLLNYHFVFCPKRRRRVLVGPVEARLKVVLQAAAAEHRWEVIALEVMPDHVHLFLGATPDVPPTQIMHALKGRSSRLLRAEFPALRRLPSLWTRSYFVSTAGNVSAATVERYIAEQKTRD
ncbi:IS200/IS605 family transposase [Roseisolibacter agri]|uniref:IS200/IS605 family transposase n=1 Tax=Roseisolibacter agri TaxID=2014610 RepID=A0AA37QLV1_9BACT|nr:IS200/IS605 family transposase [Roseisolibacter agri]GLC28223.1 IS200/IS605 family transposase [Roseisolibacter agri]